MRRLYCLFLSCFLLWLCFAAEGMAGSVYTPRNSGTEAPGGPRPSEGLPSSGSFGRTPEGGMGYTDAYGNTIDSQPKPKAPRKRLPAGAYGRYGERAGDERPLPDPASDNAKPAWHF